MNNLISVIVPIYNVEKYLNRCVDSLLAQTIMDFEIVLINDGSTDNCGLICDEYAAKDKRVKVIHKPNGGLSDARNAGIDWVFNNSDTKYFAFIDSDDFVHPRFLEIMLNTALANDADVVVCELTRDMSVDDFYNQSSYKTVNYNKHDFLLSTYPEKWSRNIATWSKIYKRFIFEDLRFPYKKKYEDIMTIHKAIMKAEKISGVDIFLYYWYFNKNSISSQRTNAISLIDREEGLRSHMFYYPDDYNDVNLAARRFYLNQMHLMLWQLDHDYVQNETTKKVRSLFYKQAKKYFRRYKDLCGTDERKRIYDYLFPKKSALKHKLKIV